MDKRVCIYQDSLRRITVYTVGSTSDSYSEASISAEQFRQILIRAQHHTEKEAPEIMNFLDIVIFGEPLQNYDQMGIYSRETRHDNSPEGSGI